jgi:hypothetical protein
MRAFGEAGEELMAMLKSEQKQRRADIPPDALVWMALVPSLSIEVAQVCDFPRSGAPSSVEYTLRRILEERLCEVTTPRLQRDSTGRRKRDPETGRSPQYWMPPPVRVEVLQEVLRDPDRGLTYLQAELAQLGAKLLDTQFSGQVKLDLVVAHWAEIASAGNVGGMSSRLMEEVDGALKRHEPSEALRWVEAAAPIGELLGGEMAAAVEQTRQRLELAGRDERDEQYLSHFLVREEQVDAFNALVGPGSNDSWALHYIGLGGVGKTMLVRYLSQSVRRTHHGSISRIDFDYLSPDFPSRAPWLLLSELSRELRVSASAVGEASTNRLFLGFDDLVERIHEQFIRSSYVTESDTALLSGSLFADVLGSFATALQRLPKPVVLLFDTCEELAKVRPADIPPNVRATFEILERLHELLPGELRVVFCGRRPLASTGLGWECTGSTLPPRSYLRLHQIRGFTPGEARRFLTEIEHVAPSLIEAILKHSPEGGSIACLKQPRVTDKDEPRYNPFDLAFYAQSTYEDTELTPELIGNTSYMRRRIIARVSEPVRLILPAVALLGRFDRETLRAASIGLEVNFDQAFDELARQEWIQYPSGKFLVVNQELLPRMRSYYEQHELQSLDAPRKAALDHLVKVTLRTPLSDLDLGHFDAALRFLADDVERGVRWWLDVERRFVTEQRYDWAATLLSYVLGPEGATAERDADDPDNAPSENPLRPLVLATAATVAIHTQDNPNLTAVWLEVETKAGRLPRQTAERLRVRAAAGRLADPNKPLNAQSLALLFTTVNGLLNGPFDEQLVASHMPALEAELESFEAAKIAPDERWVALLVLLANVADRKCSSPVLPAFCMILAGRISMLSSNRENAGNPLSWFERALNLLPDGPRIQQLWLDWRAPEELGLRVRLEYMRAARALGVPPLTVLEKAGEVMPHLVSLDSDRLASAILSLQLEMGPPSAETLNDLSRVITPYKPSQERELQVHQAWPPLDITFCEALAASGRVDEALDHLRAYSRTLESAVAGAERVRDAERATLRIVRRMRLRDEGLGITTSISLDDPEDFTLIASLDGLDGAKARWPGAGASDPLMHEVWRVSNNLHMDEMLSWMERVRAISPLQIDTDSTFAEVSWYLDTVEGDLLEAERKGGTAKSGNVSQMLRGFDLYPWWEAHSDRPKEALRLWLRAITLEPELQDAYPVPTDLLADVGQRAAANVALDEGELLALRLPMQATWLLEWAGAHFSTIGDYVGATIAQTCLCLAYASHGDWRRLEDSLRLVQESYSYIREDVVLKTVPEWDRLEHMALQPTPQALDTLKQRGWRPWLVRIIACIVARDTKGQHNSAWDYLLEWLRANYAATTNGRQVLPYELDSWLTAARAKREHVEAPSTAVMSTRQLLALVGLGLGVLAVGLVAGYYIFLFVMDSLTAAMDITKGVPTATATRIASYVIFLVILITLYPFGRLLKRNIQARWLASNGLRIIIEAESMSATEVKSAKLTWKSRKIWAAVVAMLAGIVRRRLPAPRFDTVAMATISVHPTEIYNNSAASALAKHALPTSVKKTLAPLRRHKADLELRLDPTLSGVCWEALLALMIDGVSPVDRSPVRYRRTVAGARSRPADGWNSEALTHIWSIVGDLSQEGVATQGWNAVNKDPRFVYAPRRPSDILYEASNSSAKQPQVLHLVGTPLSTASGVRLQVGESGVATKQSSRDMQGELLTSDDLNSRFPRLMLCIVQAPALDGGIDERTEIDRREASDLRTFAGELFSVGIPAVVAIPALPTEAAIEVLSILAETLYAHQGDIDALGPAVERARLVISQLQARYPYDVLETAFDLCFYAVRSDFHPSTSSAPSAKSSGTAQAAKNRARAR